MDRRNTTGTVDRLHKVDPLYRRILEIDESILAIDDAAKRLLAEEVEIKLSMAITSINPDDTETVSQ